MRNSAAIELLVIYIKEGFVSLLTIWFIGIDLLLSMPADCSIERTVFLKIIRRRMGYHKTVALPLRRMPMALCGSAHRMD